MIKILFLAANPIETEPLRLDEEIRAIDLALSQSGMRDKFEIIQHWAVRIDELQRLLLRHQPDIVHFSGHGTDQSDIIVHDEDGGATIVTEETLTRLFTLLKGNIKCVVLNACFSERQAMAIAREVEFVIGIADSISDKSSRKFASAFYQALGFGQSVPSAYDLACLEIEFTNPAQRDRPRLFGDIAAATALSLTGGSEVIETAEANPLSSDNAALGPPPTAQIDRSAAASHGSVAVTGDVSGDLTISLEQSRTAVSKALRIVLVIISAGTLILLSLQGFSLLTSLQPPTPVPMSGDFNVAIAPFAVAGSESESSIGLELAQGFANKVELAVSDLQDRLHGKFELAPPRLVGALPDGVEVAGADSAEKIAQALNADIVVYGLITTDEGSATLTPYFFVNGERNAEFQAAIEVVGVYRLGTPIYIEKVDNRRRRNDAEAILQARVQALTFLMAGLSDFMVGEYEDAEARFIETLDASGWDAQDVTYVMLGNATLEQRRLKEAEAYYRQALQLNPAYSRAYIGLGVALYGQSLPQSGQAEYAGVDVDYLDQAIETFNAALSPTLEHPPLAFVPDKAQFHLGQARLAKAIAELHLGNHESALENLKAAAESFRRVISDYEAAPHELVQDLAANAHARLGMIAILTEQYEIAADEYQQALELLPHLERTQLMRARYEAELSHIFTLLNKPTEALNWLKLALDHVPNDAPDKARYEQELAAMQQKQ